MVRPISIFISYAHEDLPFLEELKKSLVYFERNKTITVKTDKDILASEKWDEWIKIKLKESEIILFLVSRDFIASDYIHYTEIKTVIENQKLLLIPVIIRPVELSQLEFNIYQVVPSEAKPIVNWENKDEAWINVTDSLKKVFDRINHGDTAQGQNSNSGRYNSTQSNTLKYVNRSDKLVLGFIVLLLCIGLLSLIYGIIKFEKGAGHEYLFYIYISFALIGLGLFGYFYGRKSLSF